MLEDSLLHPVQHLHIPGGAESSPSTGDTQCGRRVPCVIQGVDKEHWREHMLVEHLRQETAPPNLLWEVPCTLLQHQGFCGRGNNIPLEEKNGKF